MTLITVTTVGYGEVLPLQEVEGARLFTIVLILSGMGLVLYFASTLTAFFVDGTLGHLFSLRRMRKKLNDLNAHVVVCGLGKTGRHVVEELDASSVKFAVLEKDAELVSEVSHGSRQGLVVNGDATSDQDLMEVGVQRAECVFINLGNQADNLYCTISARQLNPTCRIIVASDDVGGEEKLRRVGANSVVFTNVIGGRRVASEILRPSVATYLDLILQEKHPLNFEEIIVGGDSPLLGKSLAESKLREIGDVLVVAIRHRESGDITFNPKSSDRIAAGTALIVLGNPAEIERVRHCVERTREPN
ncbi:MAG: potassium channel protein, partial [Myxococcales bacterium]|nr:potassium channel protein [Myxococcales bacterium]